MKITVGNRSLEISPKKIYSVPKDIVAKKYAGFLILISPNNGNWIVLENQSQIEIFKLLMNGANVGKIFQSEELREDLYFVLRQIEGRNFEYKILADDNNFSLRLYLTNACNLRCKHCFVYATNAYADELSLTEIENLILTCNKHGAQKLILTGGEVLLRKDFEQILRYGKSLKMYVQVLTNGTLWDAAKVKTLSPYIDEIQISLDGFNENSNAKVRGVGVFEKVLEAVELFFKYSKIFINVIVTPMYGELDAHYNEYVNFAKNLIARYGHERFLIIFQGELLNGRNLKADSDSNKNLKNLVNLLHEDIYENSELTNFILNHKNNRLHKNCGYGGLTVDSTGNIFFCGRIGELKNSGNIRKISLEKILSLRKKIRQCTSVDNLFPCQNCELKYVCGGGCRINNFNEVVKISADDLTENLPLKMSNECTLKENFYRLMIESIDYLLE